MDVTAEDVLRARAAVRDAILDTPVVAAVGLGQDVVLKAENLQRTGAFKVRGALNKLAALGDGCATGVVCGSAGNHAQALAYAARARGVPCEVFMPTLAPVAKAEGAAALGATVHLGGASVDECLGLARDRAAATGMGFVHPFDDPDVVAGQGTLGLELLEQVPTLGTVVVPVGGGGLVSGIAVAIKSARPDVRVVGVQVEASSSFGPSLAAGAPQVVDVAATIADGIAVKRPGDLTLALVRRWVDEVVVVSDDATGEAVVLMAEASKLVVEGAGAVGVAALLAGLVAPSPGTTCVVLSGGNIDPGLLAELARRHETGAGRRLVLATRIPDQPGALAGVLDLVARAGANVVAVEHLREGVDLHVRETAVQLVLATRGHDHAARVTAILEAAGLPLDLRA